MVARTWLPGLQVTQEHIGITLAVLIAWIGTNAATVIAQLLMFGVDESSGLVPIRLSTAARCNNGDEEEYMFGLERMVLFEETEM
ncbi:hypothetical protein BU24DRAFT_89784 [Aaosphaeria arxii CBS 175.79]|uniref:Uncharacterized protein n=1 Tax=Aaosphaeria arxii CBS 175.79 TaxID=1450172 RepID=A0A6A5X7Y4_9PLEO|nr:uncharacterized protein BU24DRAFT_89784 [Aaosphaeria arxii CBS 175.79]KAF2009016.1 hypothetical protein BU24DRAFT_89784 [Aaosphaeria arxii CBS 175.79]